LSPKKDPQIGEKVWIEPAHEGVPVPYEARLRGGINSGQRGNKYKPAANKVLTRHRVRKVHDAEQVVWSDWWRRRYIQGDIKLASAPKVVTPKKGGDK